MIPLVPDWIQSFVIGGLVLLAIVVPIRVIWEQTAGSRRRRERMRGLAERLEERFGPVLQELGGLKFEHEGRAVRLRSPSDERLEFRLDESIAPRVGVCCRRGGWPWSWSGSRLALGDRLAEGWRIWSTPGFGAYMEELAHAALPETPEPFVSSLAALGRLPGLKGAELRLSPRGGVRLRLDGRDLHYRPDLIESALHHARLIHRRLVDEGDLPATQS
jgi:hypothetical protein